jgi:hypothetical protein
VLFEQGDNKMTNIIDLATHKKNTTQTIVYGDVFEFERHGYRGIEAIKTIVAQIDYEIYVLIGEDYNRLNDEIFSSRSTVDEVIRLLRNSDYQKIVYRPCCKHHFTIDEL